MPEIDGIVAAHADVVWRIAVRLLDNEQDALDCYQQTFLEATRLRHESVNNWRSLLCSIATRRAFDQLRKRYHGRKSFVCSDVEPTVDEPPDRELMGEEFREQVRTVLATLPAQQAEAFWLRHVEQQSPSDIAEQLGIQTGHVRVLVHRAIQHLRKELASEYDLESQEGREA